jgi:hypothetical protein
MLCKVISEDEALETVSQLGKTRLAPWALRICEADVDKLTSERRCCDAARTLYRSGASIAHRGTTDWHFDSFDFERMRRIAFAEPVHAIRWRAGLTNLDSWISGVSA